MLEGLHDHEDDETMSGLGEGWDEGFDEDDEALDERSRRRRVPVPRFPAGMGVPGMGIAVLPGSLQPAGNGVQTATLNTPRGSATVRLPEPVATERDFKEAISKLETTLNGLSTQVTATRSALDDSRAASASAHSQLAARQQKLAKAAKASFQKMRKQQQTALMLSAGAAALVQRENDKRFNEHAHVGGTGVPTTAANKNLPLLLLAPMIPTLFGNGSKLMGSDMTPLLVAGGLAFFILRDQPKATVP